MVIFDEVTKIYPGDVNAVDNLSLEINRGNWWS